MSIEATLVRLYLRHLVKHRSEPGAPVSHLRAQVDGIARLFPAPPSHVHLEPTTIAAREGLFLTARSARRDRVVLYLHGGGYVSGSIRMYRDLARRLSEAAGARVLLLDYRLAPEHPYPAAVDDALSAYRALLDLGLDPSRIAIAGDSAGGGLTLATLVAARDEGLPMPAAAWVISPWTDLAYRGESLERNREADPMIRVELIRPTAALYLGDAHPETPLASPIYAQLHGLPPTSIHVGSTEVLLDDSIRLAARLREHGGSVDVRVYDDLPHVFHLFAPYVRESRAAIREAGAFLGSHLHRPPA